jgi:glycerol transport system permease protein
MSTAALPASGTRTATATAGRGFGIHWGKIGLVLYLFLLMLPIYWMLNMSFRPNADILSNFSLFPTEITLRNYTKIFTDPAWYSGYINSIIYVSLNTMISLSVALPAAYAFSRYRFLGDKHLFFWLLTNRMAPPAVFLLPFLPTLRLMVPQSLQGC